MAVLEAAVAHRPQRHAATPGQPAGHIGDEFYTQLFFRFFKMLVQIFKLRFVDFLERVRAAEAFKFEAILAQFFLGIALIKDSALQFRIPNYKAI
ncbi:MAG: hypothetical protein ACPG43_09105, partial [Alcanivoracaceae bacterium]